MRGKIRGMARQELEEEIALAKMMVADLNRVLRKYTPAALRADAERWEMMRRSKYGGCESVNELQELYGYGDISRRMYESGVEFFAQAEAAARRGPLIGRHKARIQELRNLRAGTVIELQEELDELNGVKKEKPLNAFERLAAEERSERVGATAMQEVHAPEFCFNSRTRGGCDIAADLAGR